MSEFFDYDPNNGMIYSMDYDHRTDETVIHSKQDVGPILDHMADKRKKDDDSGIGRGLWHYCTIPTRVELELKQKGIDIYDKNCLKDVLREINQNYPYLKATRKNHMIRG